MVKGSLDAPSIVHPEISTCSFVKFDSSSHSSEFDRDEPAQAISEKITVWFVSLAFV